MELYLFLRSPFLCSVWLFLEGKKILLWECLISANFFGNILWVALAYCSSCLLEFQVRMSSILGALFIQIPQTWVDCVQSVPKWMSTALLVKELVLVPHFSLEKLSLSRIRNHQLMSFLMNTFSRSSNAFQGAEKGAYVLVFQKIGRAHV